MHVGWNIAHPIALLVEVASKSPDESNFKASYRFTWSVYNRPLGKSSSTQHKRLAIGVWITCCATMIILSNFILLYDIHRRSLYSFLYKFYLYFLDLRQTFFWKLFMKLNCIHFFWKLFMNLNCIHRQRRLKDIDQGASITFTFISRRVRTNGRWLVNGHILETVYFVTKQEYSWQLYLVGCQFKDNEVELLKFVKDDTLQIGFIPSCFPTATASSEWLMRLAY